MSATDIAKDAIRIVSTAGLNKDIIDLLDKKITLLTEEISSLQLRLDQSLSENSDLKQKIGYLEQQLQSLCPKDDGLKEDTKAILKFLFNAGRPISPDYLASQMRMQQSVMDYHIDLLYGRKFVKTVGMTVVMHGVKHRGQIEISKDGRAYCVENIS